MSTFFCLKPENFLTATTYGSEKKKKSAQAEKTLNKLRKAQRLAGRGHRGRKRNCFPFLLFQVLCRSVRLQILTTSSSPSFSQSVSAVLSHLITAR